VVSVVVVSVVASVDELLGGVEEDVAAPVVGAGSSVVSAVVVAADVVPVLADALSDALSVV